MAWYDKYTAQLPYSSGVSSAPTAKGSNWYDKYTAQLPYSTSATRSITPQVPEQKKVLGIFDPRSIQSGKELAIGSGEGLMNFITGIQAGLYNITGQKEKSQAIKELLKTQQEKTRVKYKINPESTESKAGRFIGENLPYAIPIGRVGQVGKLAKIATTAKKATTIERIGQVALKGAVKGAKEFAPYGAITGLAAPTETPQEQFKEIGKETALAIGMGALLGTGGAVIEEGIQTYGKKALGKIEGLIQKKPTDIKPETPPTIGTVEKGKVIVPSKKPVPGEEIIQEVTKPLKPVGTGETKVSRLARGVEQKAIANKLTETIGDLPEYREVNMADEAKFFNDLVTDDYERVKRMAFRQEQVPEGRLPESAFIAVENRALKEGDIETIKKLARSSLTTEATAMGQRIRALAERDPDSPVSAISNIIKKREKVVEAKLKSTGKDLKMAREEIIAEKNEVMKKVSKKKNWTDFIDEITC